MEPLAEAIRSHYNIEGVELVKSQRKMNLFADDVILTLTAVKQSLAHTTENQFCLLLSSKLVLGPGLRYQHHCQTRTSIFLSLHVEGVVDSLSGESSDKKFLPVGSSQFPQCPRLSFSLMTKHMRIGVLRFTNLQAYCGLFRPN